MLPYTFLIALPLVVFHLDSSNAAVIAASDRRRDESSKNLFPEYINKNLGQYAPYSPHVSYKSPPDECKVTQVNILQRHGARFPTSGSGKRMKASVEKIQSAKSFSSQLSFVPSYHWKLGTADLIPLGASESFDSGKKTAKRYKDDLGKVEPFVRTDSSQRCVDTAGNWTAGFFDQREVTITPPLVINGDAGSNNTLEDSNCPNAPTPDEVETAWLNIWAPPFTAQLNKQAPGANLENSDVLNLMQLCAFDSEFEGKLSPWCKIVPESAWPGLEYYYDLDKYYGNGYANPLGAVQGVGYINELLSRVTGDISFVLNDQTQVNHTLNDNSDATFPLRKKIYADFSHDNQMVSIFTALGLKNGPKLEPTGPPKGQQWVTSQATRFSGRLVTERLECDDRSYIRFLINDDLQKPDFCSGDDGLCSIEEFIKSQSYSTNNGNGDYFKCGYVSQR